MTAQMTPQEFVERMRRRLTLRYFYDDKNVPSPGMTWRAALAGHCYLSDSGRLADDPRWDDGRDGEGWGTTPDEAVTDLADVLLKRAAERVRHARESAEERDRERADLEAKIAHRPAT